jgi:hypothetical protein
MCVLDGAISEVVRDTRGSGGDGSDQGRRQRTVQSDVLGDRATIPLALLVGHGAVDVPEGVLVRGGAVLRICGPLLSAQGQHRFEVEAGDQFLADLRPRRVGAAGVGVTRRRPDALRGRAALRVGAVPAVILGLVAVAVEEQVGVLPVQVAHRQLDDVPDVEVAHAAASRAARRRAYRSAGDSPPYMPNMSSGLFGSKLSA